MTAPTRVTWRELSRIPLARLIPFAAVTFVLAWMASIGLPGFSGFIAELQVLIGSWRAFPWMCWFAGLGILIGIAFSWRALQATFFGEAPRRLRSKRCLRSPCRSVLEPACCWRARLCWVFIPGC
jgi:NADH:ubiquinone oxidoreductase subunit 4 (subunit M)